MGLTIPAKLGGGLVQGVGGAVVETSRFLLKSGKLITSVVADTAGAIGDVLLWKQNKKKNWKEAIAQSRKNYKKSNREDREHFWAPFEGKWNKSYGISKLVSYPTHAVYGGIKEGIKSAFDFSWRALLTLPAWGGNMFLKKENKVKLWKGENGFMSNMKNWRGSYLDGFKALKTEMTEEEKKKKEEEKKKKEEEEKKKEKEKEKEEEEEKKKKRKELEEKQNKLWEDYMKMAEQQQKTNEDYLALQNKSNLSPEEKKKLDELKKEKDDRSSQLASLCKEARKVAEELKNL